MRLLLTGNITLLSKVNAEPEVLILLSGGIDSTACLDFYLQLERPSCALFIDYGQPAAVREWQAARDVASYYDIQVTRICWEGAKPKGDGLISGRNAALITTALMEKSGSVGIIAAGIHAGTEYADCSAEFQVKIQSVLNIYDEADVQFAAPFLHWTKADIIEYCVLKSVPVQLTYSCERGLVQCGSCLSCQDRDLIRARASI